MLTKSQKPLKSAFLFCRYKYTFTKLLQLIYTAVIYILVLIPYF